MFSQIIKSNFSKNPPKERPNFWVFPYLTASLLGWNFEFSRLNHPLPLNIFCEFLITKKIAAAVEIFLKNHMYTNCNNSSSLEYFKQNSQVFVFSYVFRVKNYMWMPIPNRIERDKTLFSNIKFHKKHQQNWPKFISKQRLLYFIITISSLWLFGPGFESRPRQLFLTREGKIKIFV